MVVLKNKMSRSLLNGLKRMKRLIRQFHDSSDGCIYSVYYNTDTGTYTEVNETHCGIEYPVSRDSWHVAGTVYNR
jgi:hypothetical protein